MSRLRGAPQKHIGHSVSAAIITTGFSVVIHRSQLQTGKLELKLIFEVHLNCLDIWHTCLMSYAEQALRCKPEIRNVILFFFKGKRFDSNNHDFCFVCSQASCLASLFDHDIHLSGIKRNKKGKLRHPAVLSSKICRIFHQWKWWRISLSSLVYQLSDENTTLRRLSSHLHGMTDDFPQHA